MAGPVTQLILRSFASNFMATDTSGCVTGSPSSLLPPAGTSFFSFFFLSSLVPSYFSCFLSSPSGACDNGFWNGVFTATTPAPTPKPTPVPTAKPTLPPTPKPTPKPTTKPTAAPVAVSMSVQKEGGWGKEEGMEG